MRWLLGLVPFTIAAACGGVIADGSDAGTDGSTASCSSNSDCPNAGRCAFPDNAGCGAHRQCFPAKACKGGPYCACDGTTMLDDCSGAASKPVAHLCACYAPPPPPPDCPIACERCDTSCFDAFARGTPASATGACSAAQITAFVTACISASATQTTCTSWQQSAPACASCVITQNTSAKWGPI